MNAVDAGAPVAELDSVERRFRREESAFRLAPTTLTLARGEWVALVGRSGAGKTTLLHLLAGLDRPDRGRVALFGTDVTAASEAQIARIRREKIGIVHQEPLLLDHLPVWQNVSLRMVPIGVPAKERRDRAAALLATMEMTGLIDLLDRRPRELSGGERQRVAIARALIGEPRLLVADEPTANLDGASVEPVVELLAALNRRGTTLIVSTHDPALAARAGRRIELVLGVVKA